MLRISNIRQTNYNVGKSAQFKASTKRWSTSLADVALMFQGVSAVLSLAPNFTSNL